MHTKIKRVGDDFQLDMGGTHGLKPKQRFGLYRVKQGSFDLHHSVGTIQVTKVNLYEAEARLGRGNLRTDDIVAAPIVDREFGELPGNGELM